MASKRLRVGSLVGAWAVLGCGDGGGSGVSASKKLGDLSDSEASTVCKELVDTMRDVSASIVKGYCTGTARKKEDGCEAARAACIEMTTPEAQAAWNVFDCEGSPARATDGCKEATVGEVETCLSTLKKDYSRAADERTCSSAEDMATPEVPAACSALEATCPKLANVSFSL